MNKKIIIIRQHQCAENLKLNAQPVKSFNVAPYLGGYASF